MSRLLESLNETQKEAVVYNEGPLLILAGAGSGKTKTLTNKIAYLIQNLSISPFNILAMTFSNKAAGEMKNRVSDLLNSFNSGIWISTFHASCARILRQEIPHLGYENDFVIYDSSDQQSLVKKTLKELKFDKITPSSVIHYINKVKNKGMNFDELLVDKIYSDERKVIDCCIAYQNNLKKNNAVDFGDLLLLTVNLFKKVPEILEKYRQRFQAIFIDEYQDTNLVQYELLKKLALNKKYVSVVGDDDQSIYGWRGAEIANIFNFEKDFKNTKIIKLEYNYRSTVQILSAATKVIKQNNNRMDKTLWTERQGTEDIAIIESNDDMTESSFVINEILRRKSAEVRYKDIAVFFRTNSQSRVLEEQCIKYRLPYRFVGGFRFYERKEIKDLISYLKFLSNKNDSISLERILNVPPRGIGETTISKLREVASDKSLSLFKALIEVISNTEKFQIKNEKLKKFCRLIEHLDKFSVTEKPADLITEIIKTTDYLSFLEKEEQDEMSDRIGNVKEFIFSAEDYFKANPEHTLRDYLEKISLVSDTDTMDDTEDRITLMTVHCSKGLEFKIVFLVGAEDGYFPHIKCIAKEEIEEERRLFYVAMTRAIDKLFISYCKRRRIGGIFKASYPSIFLLSLKREKIHPSLTQNLRNTYNQVENKNSIEPNEINQESDEELLKLGTKLRHAVFGEGVVKNITGNGKDLRIGIYFYNFGYKIIAPLFTKLEIIK